MGALALLGLAVVLFIVYGIVRTGQRRVHKHGIHALTWRWLTGAAWHGDPVTDAGWLRPGRKALTRTGHASRFHHLPRWRRALWRAGPTLAVPLIIWGLVADASATMLGLKAAAAAAAAFAAWRSWSGWRRRKHRRTWLLPAHTAIAPIVNVPLPRAARALAVGHGGPLARRAHPAARVRPRPEDRRQGRAPGQPEARHGIPGREVAPGRAALAADPGEVRAAPGAGHPQRHPRGHRARGARRARHRDRQARDHRHRQPAQRLPALRDLDGYPGAGSRTWPRSSWSRSSCAARSSWSWTRSGSATRG